MLFSLALMGIDHFTPATAMVRQGLLQILQPFEYAASLPDMVYRLIVEQSHPEQSARELERLRAENQILKAKLLKMNELAMENQRLRQLLDATSQLPIEHTRFIIASVLRTNQQSGNDELVLNKGSMEGIEKSLPVLDTAGVLGLISDVAGITSRARLLTDPSMEIPVRVERTGQRAITRGLGHGRLEINFVRQGTDIRPGDRLVTSGLGGIYPSGYPVAKVVEVRSDTGDTFMTIYASPISQLYNNHEVLILKHAQAPSRP